MAKLGELIVLVLLFCSSLINVPQGETCHEAIVFSWQNKHICGELCVFFLLRGLSCEKRQKNLNEVNLKLM